MRIKCILQYQLIWTLNVRFLFSRSVVFLGSACTVQYYTSETILHNLSSYNMVSCTYFVAKSLNITLKSI